MFKNITTKIKKNQQMPAPLTTATTGIKNK